jgi:hypothetical protein
MDGLQVGLDPDKQIAKAPVVYTFDPPTKPVRLIVCAPPAVTAARLVCTQVVTRNSRCA